MQVAILIGDGGDGSAHLCWFKDIELADKLANSDKYCEDFGLNESSPTIIEVQEDFMPPGGWSTKEDFEEEDDEDC